MNYAWIALFDQAIDICVTSRSHYPVILGQRKIQCTLKYLQIHRGRSWRSGCEGATSDESRRDRASA